MARVRAHFFFFLFLARLFSNAAVADAAGPHPRLGSPRRLFITRLRIAVLAVSALLTLFAFFLAQLPG